MSNYKIIARCVALVMLLSSMISCSPTPQQTKSPEASNTTGAPTTDEVPPTTQSSPDTTSSVTDTPLLTLVPPLSETLLPTLTPTPTPEETENEDVVDFVPTVTSGEFKSDTGTLLNLICTWTLNKTDSGSYELTLNVDLTSYSLYAIAKDSGVVKIGEDKFKYSTPSIKIDREAGKQLTHFTSVTHELTREELENGVELYAKWVFNGSYSSTPITDIIATQTVYFK